jgi:hypothetical protein
MDGLLSGALANPLMTCSPSRSVILDFPHMETLQGSVCSVGRRRGKSHDRSAQHSCNAWVRIPHDLETPQQGEEHPGNKLTRLPSNVQQASQEKEANQDEDDSSDAREERRMRRRNGLARSTRRPTSKNGTP